MYFLKEFNSILVVILAVLIVAVVFGLLMFTAIKIFLVGTSWINEWFNKYMPQ